MTRRWSQRGFVLVNVIIVIGLLGAFAVVATHVFRLAIRTSSAAAVDQDERTRLEQALGVLRRDAWEAKALEIPEMSKAVLAGAGKRPIVWTTQKDGAVVRTVDAEERRWKGLNLSFEREGRLVVVRRDGNEVALLRQASGGNR
jgi:type II secretory pathway component PulJ